MVRKSKAEKLKEWRKKNPDKDKSHKLKRSFGIDINKYNEMLKNQDHKCAICKTHESEFKKKFAVDHSHSSSKIRGLLCSNCNTALGLAKDSINRLFEMVNYLLSHGHGV